MSHPCSKLEPEQGETMDQSKEEIVPDPIAQALAAEMERAEAARAWAALVKECAARGDA